jgi:hypothetical protein
MSFCAGVRAHVSELIEHQAHVRYSAYKPPRELLVEPLAE